MADLPVPFLTISLGVPSATTLARKIHRFFLAFTYETSPYACAVAPELLEILMTPHS
jgi:adenosylmethionine-8-amino-7-oxononanoate aminotransferase